MVFPLLRRIKKAFFERRWALLVFSVVCLLVVGILSFAGDLLRDRLITWVNQKIDEKTPEALSLLERFLGSPWLPVVIWLVIAIIAIALFVSMILLLSRTPKEKASSNKNKLNIRIEGTIRTMSRILDTPEGKLWELMGTSYAGGLMWQADLLFVNRESQPVNIMARLALSTNPNDLSKRAVLEPLPKPLIKHRDTGYYFPDHLKFPVYLGPGKPIKGRAQFALYPQEVEAAEKGNSLRHIMLSHNHILKVEDLISGKRLEHSC